MGKRKKPSSTRDNSGKVLFVYCISLALLFLASFVPELRLWGVSVYAYFGWYGRAALLIVGLAIPLLLSSRRLESFEEMSSAAAMRLTVITAVILAASFYVLRARTHFLGDGYQLLFRLKDGTAEIRPWNKGLYFLQETVFGVLGEPSLETAELAFQIIAWGFGLLLLALLVWVAYRLTERPFDRFLIFLGLSSGGYMLLYFGYVENYPPLTLAIALTSLCGLLAVEGKLNGLWVIPGLALAGWFHPFSVFLIPAALFALLHRTAIGKWIGGLNLKVRWGFLTVTVGLGLAVIWYGTTQSMFLRFALVPMFTDRFTVAGYTWFSGSHLLDYANLLILLVPGLLVLLTAITAERKKELVGPSLIYLLLLIAPILAIVFVIDPKLGMPRDWDVLSTAGFPLALTLFVTVLVIGSSKKTGRLAALLAATLGLLVLAPRAIVQAIPDKGLALITDYAELDTMKSFVTRFIVVKYLQREGRTEEAEAMREPWGALAVHERYDVEGNALFRQGRFREAERKFRQAIAFLPTYANSWTNLAACLMHRGALDSALYCLKIADGNNPFNPHTYIGFGDAYTHLGDYDRAEKYLLEAARLDPDDFEAYGRLFLLYARQERTEEIDRVMQELAAKPNLPADYCAVVAAHRLEAGDSSKAGELFRAALDRGLDSVATSFYESRYGEFFQRLETEQGDTTVLPDESGVPPQNH